MKQRRILITGHQQHGKDHACEFLEKEFGLKWVSSSWFACQHFLFDELKETQGYLTPEECHADRHNHTKYWYESIRRFNDEDRARLSKLIFQSHDIYCGMRDLDEFNASDIDLVIWIDASSRVPIESAHSMKLSEDQADIIIKNNGTVEEFEHRLRRLFKALQY